MYKKKIFLTISLLLTVTLIIAHGGWAETRPETKGPIITHAYAIDKGQYGTALKIYIEAEDPNGDMLRIATVATQLGGYGRYPTNWIYLKPEYQKHLKGYIQWNTFSTAGETLYEWTYVTLEVSIFDKAGKESNVVVIPFTFVSGPDSKSKPPAPFDQGNLPRLGHVDINLRSGRQ